MKSLILAFCLFLSSVVAQAQATPMDAALKRQVDSFLNEWHDDAAHARLAFFDKIAKDGVYIGTDKTELWYRDEFKVWAKRFFERKSAWAFKPLKRNVYASGDKSIIWFDEQLDTQMGVCQASGVIRKTAKGFRDRALPAVDGGAERRRRQGHKAHQGFRSKGARPGRRQVKRS